MSEVEENSESKNYKGTGILCENAIQCHKYFQKTIY